MRLTEQIQNKKTAKHSYLCHLSKNLYNSKCSFLDNESILKQKNYAGKRINRGLFRSKKGIILNADVNAGYNIIKKVVPNAVLVDGIEGIGLYPYSIAIT